MLFTPSPCRTQGSSTNKHMKRIPFGTQCTMHTAHYSVSIRLHAERAMNFDTFFFLFFFFNDEIDKKKYIRGTSLYTYEITRKNNSREKCETTVPPPPPPHESRIHFS